MIFFLGFIMGMIFLIIPILSALVDNIEIQGYSKKTT